MVSNELAGRGTDIYVVDSAAGTNNTGAIFQVDPTTGNRKLFSDFGNGAQGPGVDPTSITIAPVDLRGAGAKLLVLDSNGGTNSVGTILEVDGNGNRTVVSDLGNPAQGEPAVSPQQIVNGGGLPGLDHVLYLTDNLATDSSGTGVVFGIDLANGHRSIVNSFSKSDQAVSPLNLTGITLNEEGDLVVINDQSASATESSDVFRLSPSNGRLTVVTNCGNSAFGPCIRPIAITQAP